MMRRELLQLAHTYKPEKHDIAGWFISEKLDGTRCFWDGGLSRDVETNHVPWASTTDPKNGRRKAKIKPVATGLWSRYGNPIMAPDWFLDLLPPIPLDGELCAGRGNFQLCRSICAGDTPDPRFDQIRYMVYGSPPLDRLFMDGEIKNPNFHRVIRYEEIRQWIDSRRIEFHYIEGWDADFDHELFLLEEHIGIPFVEDPENPGENLAFDEDPDPPVQILSQTLLPVGEQHARECVEVFLKDVLDCGGEGVVIRDPDVHWTPRRTTSLLKYKPFNDSETVIIGFVAGKEGKQGNVLGKIGALRVRWGEVEFEIGSGMTMAERALTEDAHDYAAAHPGEVLPDRCDGKHLKRGQTVTFKYRDLSDDGVPKEARFWRRREGVE